MSKTKDGPAAHFEVEDPEAAFRKMEAATRKIFIVPKRAADASVKHVKKKTKRH